MPGEAPSTPRKAPGTEFLVQPAASGLFRLWSAGPFSLFHYQECHASEGMSVRRAFPAAKTAVQGVKGPEIHDPYSS